MENNSHGRQTHNLGGSGSVNKRGSGLGTGPVGSKNGYSGRGGSSSGSNHGGGNRGRRGGIGGVGIAIIVIIIALKLFGGGWNIGGVTDTVSSLTGVSSGSAVSTIMNLSSNIDYATSSTDFSSFTGSVANNTKPDTTVAVGSREKRTTIKGNGADVVTIMVYLCGTDLESKSGMASSDLREMCNASLSENVNIIVYTGGCTAWKTSGISNKVNQIYKIENGSLTCLESDMGNHSMTDPATLTDFIKYCVKNYPANRQELILWDHGGGSISGFGYDEKAKSGSMTLSGINKALKNAGTTFDFIGFDACLMATVENGLMLANYADYMIASEETEPGVGWYYTNWLTKLSNDTSMSTVEIGKNIVDDFIDVCNQKCNGQKTTLSVVDLAELSNTVPSELKEFALSTNELIQSDNYRMVSNARSNTKEFAQSSKIDQIDLVDFAKKLNTEEGDSLARALQGAVKYNRTASCVKDAYGLSIYFPYQKANKINQVVNTYNEIGMDSEYSNCIREFAGIEASGQLSAGGTSSAYTTLSGGNYSSSATTSSAISSLLGSIISGDGSSTINGFDLNALSSLLSGSSYGFDRAAVYISNNRLDSDLLVWVKNSNGDYAVSLSKEQWGLVNELVLNVFVDDGEGYIDLGLDNIYTIENGDLLADYDGSWLSINGQIVPYYFIEQKGNVISGYVPVFLNGIQAELILIFDTDHPYGYISGAKYTYDEEENDTVAKDLIALVPGDKLDFVCDYYNYDGKYQDSYYLGEQMVLGDTIEIGNITISGKVVPTYRLTDIYHQEYWTPVLP